MSDADIQEIRTIFLEEMAELVPDVERDLLSLEETPEDRGLVDRLFRNLHTIKGGAGVAGLDALSHYTHAVENMLDEIRKGRLALTSSLVSLLLEALDCLKSFMAEALGSGALDASRVEDSRNSIVTATGGGEVRPATIPSASPVVASPVPDATSTSQPAVSHTFVIQVHVRLDFLPLYADLAVKSDALRELGELFAVSHEHSLPAMGKRKDDAYYLWRSFHLVTDVDATTIAAVLDDWCTQHQVEIIPIGLLQAEPENQARVDAAVDGVNHDVVEVARRSPPPAAIPATTTAKAPVLARMTKPEDGRADISAVQKLSSIRVDTGKLDKLVNLVGELITVEARLDSFHTSMDQRDAEQAERLLGILDDSSRTLRELQDQAMTIRMVPIGGAFDPLQRLVRDYCRDTGKRALLTISGHDTEVDKKVLEQISGPLKHLIRNALDHGIESPAEREAAGKPSDGQITLAAYHQFGLIIIEVTDDGRGIDVARVIESAKQKGVIDAGRDLSEREGLELIFAPAVTTAEEVTEVSGRGVGMDVVKRDIEALRGSVEIATELGKGTTITVRIPMTLSIVDGLLVRVGDIRYIIPLSSVEECVELPDIAHADGSNFLDIRDELVPFLGLRTLFNVPGEAPPYEKVVIISTGERRVGLVVDQLLGDHQTVIKPLSPLHRDVHCFLGATILGDGGVVLILDVLHLIEFGVRREELLRAS